MKPIRFTLDGRDVFAMPDETIWQAAQRLGTTIPHLCYRDAPDYRADGNCRACMVEISGERSLAASCRRAPQEGMAVNTASARAHAARRMVFELLVADQPPRERSPDPDSLFWRWAEHLGVITSRLPGDAPTPLDMSHPAIAVNLDACINCGLCVRACREVQVNDVIGMAARGHDAKVVFDFADPMGESSCVACGECVQACPTGALVEKSLVNAAAERVAYPERTVDSICPYCGVGCQTTVHVQGQRILTVEGRDGPANHNRLCVKGRFGFDYAHHPDRLTMPLLRRDGAVKSPEMLGDAEALAAQFREASWDEALARVADGFTRLRARHGGGALAGFGSAKGSNEEAYLFQKLIRTGFRSNNVDHCTRLCHASSVAALMEGIGSGAVTAPFNAAAQADCIVVIGARPTTNHPVAATFFKQAAKRGAKLILIDPRRQPMARYAWRSLQFTPGSDVALLNALLHTVVHEGLYDAQYVQAMAEGFDELRARLAPYTPEAMAPVCGIAAATLREVARAYAGAQRSIIFWGMGISQHTHGTDNARALIALALSTGQIGRPGTGLHPLRGQNNVQGASDVGLIPMVYPDYRPVDDAAVRVEYEAFWRTDLNPNQGLTVVEIMNAAYDRAIRGMYIMGENPAMSDPNLNHARAGLARLDHLVVQDIFLTETAALADVVLPASAHAEKLGSYTNTNRQIQIGRPVLPLPGQARQDWRIIQDIARGIGLDWRYTGVPEVFAEMTQVMPSLANITWQRLEREGSVTYPCNAPDQPGQDILFGARFPTPSGRGAIKPVDLLPPDERPDADYPLILTTGRQLEHWHTGSMTRRAEVLDALEPLATVSVNPADAARLGVADGEQVQLITRRGRIELHLRIAADMPVGLVFVPFAYVEAAANLLTNPQLDPFGKIPEFKFCAVRLARMAAAPPLATE